MTVRVCRWRWACRAAYALVNQNVRRLWTALCLLLGKKRGCIIHGVYRLVLTHCNCFCDSGESTRGVFDSVSLWGCSRFQTYILEYLFRHSWHLRVNVGRQLGHHMDKNHRWRVDIGKQQLFVSRASRRRHCELTKHANLHIVYHHAALFAFSHSLISTKDMFQSRKSGTETNLIPKQ